MIPNWPDFLPPPLFVDFETATGPKYDIQKLPSSVHYFKDARFFVQCVAYADPLTKSAGVLWHDQDIAGLFDRIPCHERTLVAHNALFDAKVLTEAYGKLFPVYVCSQVMSRILLRHQSKGSSLDAVYHALFNVRFKTVEVETMRGIREVPEQSRSRFGNYAMKDVAGMVRIVMEFLKGMPDSQWWHMDWAIRQFVDPVLDINTAACHQFLAEYEEESLALYGKFNATKSDFSSVRKFAKVLAAHGLFDPMGADFPEGTGWLKEPHIPVVVGGGKNPKLRYDFSKKSEGFITQVLESNDPVIAELGQLRLRAASSSEVAQASKLLAVAEVADNQFGLAINCSGTATHRISGNGDACGINVLAIKRGSTLRKALSARRGRRLLSLDMSAFELGICRFLSQDEPSMDALLDRNRDLYVEFARIAYKDPLIEKATHKAEREVGKTSELQLQYNSGARTLRGQLLEKGAHVTLREAEDLVHTFRHKVHKSLYRYWGTFGTYLNRMRGERTQLEVKNAPFLIVEHGGIRLPNGLKLYFPDLRQQNGEWTYRKNLGQSYVRDKIYGGKLMQYCCQSLANVIIQEKKRAIAREFGLRCCHEVYDDLTLDVPADITQSTIDEVMEMCVTPLDWWPELPLSLEWGLGKTWGDCDKSNKVYGPQIL